jgi:hypothetical protein
MSTLNYTNIFNSFFADTDLWRTLIAWIETTQPSFEWLESNLHDSPTIAISLGAAILIPLLAATGSLLRLALPDPPAGAINPKQVPPSQTLDQRAFLEFQRHNVLPFEIRHAIVRIGRETDNDVKLEDLTVHRYHAVIERTPEGEFHIAYVGAPDGNGLRINGRKVRRQRLTGGEILDIGATKMHFTTVIA